MLIFSILAFHKYQVMQAIFINSTEIVKPEFFTKYYNASGEHYQRIESTINNASFHKDCDAVRIELYRNSTGSKVKPVLVGVLHRAH